MKTTKNLKNNKIRSCEGMRRHGGGAFSLGPPIWEKCKNKAVVILKIKQKDEKATNMSACMQCWNEAQDPQWGIKILKAEPIKGL